MKTTIFILLISFFSLQMMAGEGNTSTYEAKHGKLNVTIEGLTSDKGDVKILLFNNETGFPLQEWNAVYAVNHNIETEGYSMSFESIPFGEYALFIYHDENQNGKLDKNWSGAAKEGFGYSNMTNAKRLSPLYSQSVFSFEKDGTEMTIHIIPAKMQNREAMVR